MRSRQLKLSALLIAGTLILTLGSGCGKRVGSVVDPAEQPTAAPTAAPDPLPSTPIVQPTPPTTLPGTPGNPSTPVNPGAQLQAVVESVKNGSFLGMGTLVAKVKVTNPTQYSLSGEVTVSFTNGGQASTEVASERVTLMPNETITKYFESKKWTLDGATVTIKTDAPLANSANSYGNGYGNGYGY
jgi:hypothetical protein